MAAPLSDGARIALAHRLGDLPIPGKVVPPENWHLTLRFLGWTEPVAYDLVLASLDQAQRGAPFEIELGGLGAFPRPRRATVTWIAVTKGQARLDELAALSEEAAQTAGFSPEDRPYRAHLTLSRVRPPEDVTGLIESFDSTGIRWRCRSLVVYRSHLSRGGARYEPLETFPLER